MGFLDSDDLARLVRSSATAQATPIPLQMVSSDEYLPSPKTAQQAEVGARLGLMADEIGGQLGLSRRKFFQSAGGMAAAFVAMNQTYGAPLFAATLDEARSPDMANARAAALKDQFIIDVHTHFVDGAFLPEAAQKMPFPWRKVVKDLGWNPAVGDVSMKAVQFANYHKEIYFDSDTKIALISSAPGTRPGLQPLSNPGMAEARAQVNREAGSQRMLSHALFMPGAPGWIEALDAAIELKPDSWKGYTIGSNSLDAKYGVTKMWPWRMDGEDAYKAYEKMAKSGITTVCVHKGLGADKVCWGTDAVWTGSPQWQIEGLRRLEIPADMRRRHGFARLGSATGTVKSAILADNSARLYKIGSHARRTLLGDRLAIARARYELAGRVPSNRQYGFVARAE